MANWWEAAPLAQKETPAASANWWDAAPLAQAAKPAEAAKANEPSVSMTEALGRGAARGVSGNFYEELRGLVEAGGANPRDPASLYKLIGGAIKYWTGDGDAEQRYDQTLKREEALTKKVEAERPYSSIAGNIAGAAALPVGAYASAATLPGRIVRGAAVGAGMGGLAGAGEGQGAIDRLSRGATGAAFGAGVGALLPVGVEGVVRGARAVAQPVANAVRGVRDAEGEAARRVALALERDIKIDPAASGRLSAQDFVSARNAGTPVNFMDMGGETTRALARSAANTSPEGRAALAKVIDDRFEGQAPRVAEWLGRNFNYPDAGGLQIAMETAARNANRPAYAKAYAQGQGLWDDSLEQLSQAPVVQQAIRLAFVTGRNKDTLAGFPPLKNPFSLNKETGAFELAPGTTPNLQFWDHVKRNLDKLGAEGQAFSKALRGHLDDLVPSYKDARAGAAKAFDAEDALEAGQKFITAKMDPRDAARAIAKFTPEERKVFQDGVVSQFTKTLNDVGDKRSVLNKIAESPNARRNLELALGPQKARELEAMLRVEGIMDLARNAVQGNSSTARQLTELGLAGGTYGFSGGVSNPLDMSALANAAMVYGAAKGKHKINEKVSRKVAEMLASSDPAVLLRGIKMVSNNQQLFNSLRAADKGLARIGGQQASGFAPMQAAGAVRADENQPNVPRP